MSNPAPSSTPAAPKAPPAWAEPGIGLKWQHRFFHWLIRVGGPARGYHISLIVSFWYVLLYPSIRRRCRHYLNRRFPQRRGILVRFLDDFRLVRTYGAAMIDMVVLEVLGPRAIAATCPEHDRLIKLCENPKGFVLLHAHIGCFQVALDALRQFPKHVSIVMIPETRAPMLLKPQAAGMIDPRSGVTGVMEMTDALLRGEILAMMGDRTFGSRQNSVPAKFLGDTVMLPLTPYRLASATECPILVMGAPKTSPRSYEIRILKVIEVPPNLGRGADEYAPYAQQFADAIEQFTAENPWQFYNFYDLWSSV
jgi:predicted LPLAT superfamily acyltransferase